MPSRQAGREGLYSLSIAYAEIPRHLTEGARTPFLGNGGSALTLLIVNIAFTFAVPGISIGGHLGGLAGGALCILALSRFGKGSAAYSRIDTASVVSLVAIGLLSVAVAYWKVKGYA